MKDKAHSRATVQRLFLIYALLFALGAVVMATKHKLVLAGIFFVLALLNSVGVALYFRLRVKRL